MQVWSESEARKVFALRVVCDADPSAAARVLEFFVARNVIPITFRADMIDTQTVDIDVRINTLDAQRMSIIAAKIRQLVFVRGVMFTVAGLTRKTADRAIS